MTCDTYKYMANQIQGPVVQSLLQGAWAGWSSEETYVEYLRNYALESKKISTSDLDSLGRIVAIPRPYAVSVGDDESFLYGTSNYEFPETWRRQHGFGAVGTTDYGGILSNSQSGGQSISTVNDYTYIRFMQDLLKLRKTYSLSDLSNVIYDVIAPVVVPGDPNNFYKLEYTNKGDIRVTIDTLFSRYSSYLQVALSDTYTASPQVTIVVGSV